MGDGKGAELSIELNAVDNVSETTKKVEKRVTSYENACKKTADSTGSVMNSAAVKFAVFSAAAVATAKIIQDSVVAPMKAMLQTFSQTGFALDKMTRSARLSVETLGALGFAAEQTGSSTEGVASAMQNMESKIEAAQRGSLSAMQELYRGCGTTFAELEKLSPEERFMKVADVISKVGNEADKAEIARRMFGSDDLLPLLKKGREGIQGLMQEGRDLGGPWSKENVRASQELAKSMNRIKTVFNGLRDSFLTSISESIQRFLSKMLEVSKVIQKWVADHPKLTAAIAGITAAVVAIGAAGLAAIPIFMGISTAFGAVLSVVSALLSPFILIPAAVMGGVAAFLKWSGALDWVLQKVQSVMKSAFDAITWFFGDAIALIGAGEWGEAWKNLCAKTELIFLTMKQSLSDAIQGLWTYVLQASNDGITQFTQFLDDFFFNGNEVFSKLWQSVSQFFTRMLDTVGASSSSFSEIFLAAWFAIKKGVLSVWYAMKAGFISMVSGFKSVWIGFRKELQAGVNYLYGKMTGLSDEEIGQMTIETDAEFDKKSKAVQEEKDAALKQNDEEKDAVTEAARLEIAGKIEDSRRKAAENEAKNNERVEVLTREISQQKEIIRASTPELDPNDPDYQSGGGPAGFLREQIQDSSKGTQNSFQAIFGMGQTTEQQQLQVSKQIFGILQMIAQEGAVL